MHTNRGRWRWPYVLCRETCGNWREHVSRTFFFRKVKKNVFRHCDFAAHHMHTPHHTMKRTISIAHYLRARSGPGSTNPCAQYPPDAAQSPRAWHTRSEPSEQMLPRKCLRKRHVPRTLTCGGHFLRTTPVVRMPFALLQPAVRRSQLATQRLPSCTPAPQYPTSVGPKRSRTRHEFLP